jgi:hypothetical protein
MACLIGLCGLLAAGHAAANDSSAELSTGGLVLTHSDGVEMRSEDLFISAKAVRVKYRFFNTTAHEVTAVVAFPMPDITVEGEDDNTAIPTQDPRNILGFSTWVDGRAVTAQVEQKVLKDGVDRTALLRSMGVPLAPHLPSTGRIMDQLPAAAKQTLLRLNLAAIEEYDAGKGWEKHIAPRWTLKTTYYWRQAFPAGREIVVEHHYKPSVGGTVESQIEIDSLHAQPSYRAYLARYCIDPDLIATVKRTKTTSADGVAYSEAWIDYVLKTGGNWKSPIGSFRLVVDKGAADNLISFCGQGVTKISPTQFEMRKTDFRPTSDLAILILQRHPQ